MDLPNLFAVDTSHAATRLCAVIVTDTTVQAALISISVSGVSILAQSNIVPYSDGKTLVYSADVAFQDLGKGSEDVNEVVFILEESWLDADGGVDGDHQDLIERLRKDLLLNPVGFVVQQEAIADFLISKRPQLSTLIFLAQQQVISASWLEHGSLVASVQQKRSNDLNADAAKIAQRLQAADPGRPLPNNVVATSLSLSSPTLSQLQEKLLDVPWRDLGFGETPSVEVLTTQLAARSTFDAAGNAMHDVMGGEGGSNPAHAPTADDEVKEDIDQIDDDLEDPNDNLGPPPVLDDDGSLTGGTPAPTSLGVPIRQKYETAVDDSLLPQNRGVLPYAPRVDFDEPEPDDAFAIPAGKKKVKLPKPVIFGLAALAGLLVVAAVLAVVLIFTRKAVVEIEPTTQVIAEDVTLTLSANDESNAATRTMHAAEVGAEVSGNSETATTGVKLVGEKANGEISITNKTMEEKTFSSGTTFTANSKTYTLNDEVKVPAATEDDDKLTFGKANGRITASDIGVESNVAEKTKFKVANFGDDQFDAVANSDIGGGTSREVKVIAEADLRLVLQDLQKDLAAQAKEKLKAELPSDQQVVINNTVKNVKVTYSGEVGDEADSVKLNLTVNATGLAYSKADVKPIADAILQSKLPEGYSMENSVPEILSAATADGNGKNVIEANVSVKAAAVVDAAAVAASAAGKRESEAIESVKAQAGVANAVIRFSPSFVKFFYPFLPAASNISVTTKIPE